MSTITHGANKAKYLQDSHLQLNHAVEVVGKVQNDLSVRVLACTDFGPEGNIGIISLRFCMDNRADDLQDFKAVEAVVDATHRYHEIFYEKQE